MEPLEPAPGNRQEARRPLLMDPAGARPSGFAPPSVLSAGHRPAAGRSSRVAGRRPARRRSPTAAGAPHRCCAGTPSQRRAGRRCPGEASFGPVSQVVRVSVRTLSSRIDLVLPDRSTIAETLETVLELAPRSLREQAIAHGGWILRTAAGEAIPGSSTLLDQGIVDGATLFLTGIDAADTAAVYDDVADAVADTVTQRPVRLAGRWRPDGRARRRRTVRRASACLSLLWAGPPWTAVAITLGSHCRARPGRRRSAVPRGRRCRRGDGGRRCSRSPGRRRGGHRRHRRRPAVAGDRRPAAAAGRRRGRCLRDHRGPGRSAPGPGRRSRRSSPAPAAVHRARLLRDLRSARRPGRRDRRRARPRADAVGADLSPAAGPVRAGPAAHHRRRGLRRPRDRRCPGRRGRHPAGRRSPHRADPGSDLAGPGRPASSWRSPRTSPRRYWPAWSASDCCCGRGCSSPSASDCRC